MWYIHICSASQLYKKLLEISLPNAVIYIRQFQQSLIKNNKEFGDWDDVLRTNNFTFIRSMHKMSLCRSGMELSIAAKYDNLTVVKWLIKNRIPWLKNTGIPKICDEITYTINETDHIKSNRWLFRWQCKNNDKIISWKSPHISRSKLVLILNRPMLKWTITDNVICNRVFDMLCKMHDWPKLQYLLRRSDIDLDIGKRARYVFEAACIHGDLTTVRYMHKKYKMDESADNFEVIKMAAHAWQKEIVQYLSPGTNCADWLS